MVADETSQHILKMVNSVSVSESKRKTYLPPEDFSQMAGFASAAALFAKRSLTH